MPCNINVIKTRKEIVMFEYFWYTKSTIPDGLGFSFLGPRHIITWLIALAIIVAGTILYKRASAKTKETWIWIVATALIAEEIVKDIVVTVIGQWEIDYLPLHICGINIILTMVYAITRSKIVADLLYCIGTFGAALALTTPNWMALPVMNFMHLHSVSVHILLVLFPIMIILKGHRPDIRNWLKCFLIAVCYCVPVYVFNKFFDTDFVFLNGARDTPFVPLVNLIGPLYVIPMIMLLGLVMLLMYLPWYISDRKKAKNA